MESIASLITAAYSDCDAKAYVRFHPTESQLNELAAVGVDIQKNIPVVPGACLPMSALFAARWNSDPNRPFVYVVTGELYVGKQLVFGGDVLPKDCSGESSICDLSWDSHSWLVMGSYIADVSLIRTGRSPSSPPSIAKWVNERMAPKQGLFIANEAAIDQFGIRYVAKAVLSADQVTACVRGFPGFLNIALNQ